MLTSVYHQGSSCRIENREVGGSAHQGIEAFYVGRNRTNVTKQDVRGSEESEREEDNGVKSGQRMYPCEQTSKSDWWGEKVDKRTKQ